MEKTEKKPTASTAAAEPLPRKTQLLTTICILAQNVAFGSSMTFNAPAVETFRVKYDTSVDEISRVFTIMLIAYCLGGLTSAFAYRWVNRQIATILYFTGMGVGLVVTPHCPNIPSFFVAGFLIGYCVGAYDSVQIVWMMELWQSKAGPFIQAQHFGYALGSNIPPLLLGPFLIDKEDDEDEIDNVPIDNSTTSLIPTTLKADPEDTSRIFIPFTIGGIFAWIFAVCQIFLFIFYQYHRPPVEEDLLNGTLENSGDSVKGAEAEKDESTGGGINWTKVRLVIVAAMFLSACQGMEMCTFEFIPIFGQYSDLNLSESKAAYVSTGLTGAFALGRFLGIFLILKIAPIFILCLNLVLIIIGNVILLIWANSNLTMLWTACILLGLGFSSNYASYSAFIERNLVFTNAIGSFMVVCGSTISAIYPLIVGRLIEERVVVLTYTNFFSIICASIGLTLTYLFTYKRTERVR